ncbi:WD40-repeat-containing domain protein [Ustulina deusta]|nr:WD40-repeat-containing domain protein [Ustulina deusta]
MAASALVDGDILLWDTDKGTPIRALRNGHSRPIKSLAFSQNGQVLVSARNDSIIGIWDIDSGKLLRQLKGHEDWIRSALFSPDDQFVASASDDKALRVWNIKDCFSSGENKGRVEKDIDMGGQPINQTESRVRLGHEDYVFCVAFAADGQYLASSRDEHRILLWDLRNGASNCQEARQLSGEDAVEQGERGAREQTR